MGRRSSIGTPTSLPLAARRVGSHHPRIKIGRQPRVECFAQQTSQRGCSTIGRKRNRHTRPAHDAARIRTRVRGIVDSVHEHMSMLCRIEHVLVNRRRCRSHHVPDIVEIRRHKWSLIDRHARLMKFRSNLRRHNGYECAVRQKARKLPCGDLSAAHEKDSSTSQLQKDGIHTSPVWFTPMR